MELLDQMNAAAALQTGGWGFERFGSVDRAHLRLCGSFDVLIKGFLEVKRHLKENRVRLRIVTKSPETISNLIHACLLCEDHKGSLGIVYESDLFLVVKTIPDMIIILEYLSGTELSNNKDGTIAKGMSAVKFVGPGYHFEVF
jgi:hypothetical protein